jgi:hypothetical protein
VRRLIAVIGGNEAFTMEVVKVRVDDSASGNPPG